MLNKRTRNSKTWINFDGSYTTEIHTGDVHFDDENGNLQNINTDLFDEADFDIVDYPVAREGSERYRQAKEEAKQAKNKGLLDRSKNNFQALRVPFDCHIPRNFQRGYTIGKGQDKLTFKPVKASPSMGELAENNRSVITYQDVWNDTDVELKVLPNGIKETLWLKTDKAPTNFSFEVKGKDIAEDFTAGALKLMPAWLQDANGTKRDVEMVVTQHNDNKMYVELNADVSDLVYPIEIDPTVTIQPDGASGKDTYVSSFSPDVNFAGQEMISFGRDGGTAIDRAMLEFDLSGISGKTTSAILSLFIYSDRGNEYPFGVHRITSTWEDTEPTWNNQPAFDTTADASFATANDIDVTSLVDKWTSSGYPNFGMLIKSTNEDAYDTGKLAYSSERANYQERPKLTITYNHAPTKPTLLVPNGGEAWNSLHTVSWVASTDEDSADLQYQIQLSSDNGSTWKDIVALTNINITSQDYDFINETESSTSKIRIRAFDGASYGAWDESDGVFTIQHNQAPTSPTNLTPSGGEGKDRASSVRLSWQHNDANSDPQAKFDLQWRLQGSTTWNFISNVTIDQFYDFPTNTFPKGTIEWRVRTYDQADLSSPYSATEVFYAGDKPSNATITSPKDGDIVVLSNPVVQWSSFGQVAYHVRVLDVNGNLLWESISSSTNKSLTIGYNLENLKQYKIQVAIRNSDNLWSDFVTSNITISYTQPIEPILTVSSNSNLATINIAIEHPTGENIPSVVSTRLYRRKNGESEWKLLTTTESLNYTDFQCSFGVFEYSAISIGSNGTQSNRSLVMPVDVQFDGWWIFDKESGEGYQFIYNIPSISVNIEEERYEFKTFSSKPFIRYGDYKANRGSLSGLKITNEALNPREQSLKLISLINKRKPMILKNHFGDLWTVNIHSPIRNLNPNNYEEISIEWVEV